MSTGFANLVHIFFYNAKYHSSQMTYYIICLRLVKGVWLQQLTIFDGKKISLQLFFVAFIVMSDKALNSLCLCEHKAYDWASPRSLVCQVHLIKTSSWSEYRNRGGIVCEDVYRTLPSTKALRMNKYIYCTLLYYFEKRLVEIQWWIITFFSSLFFPFPSFLYPT